MNSLNGVLFPDGFILEKCATGRFTLAVTEHCGVFFCSLPCDFCGFEKIMQKSELQKLGA